MQQFACGDFVMTRFLMSPGFEVAGEVFAGLTMAAAVLALFFGGSW